MWQHKIVIEFGFNIHSRSAGNLHFPINQFVSFTQSYENKHRWKLHSCFGNNLTSIKKKCCRVDEKSKVSNGKVSNFHQADQDYEFGDKNKNITAKVRNYKGKDRGFY